MGDQEILKKKAAECAVEFVQSGMVVGLGTGSTTGFALELSGEAIKAGRLKDIVERDDLARIHVVEHRLGRVGDGPAPAREGDLRAIGGPCW